MTEKERILTVIINSIYPKYLLENRELFHKCLEDNINIGDLVLSNTSGFHDFTIGYVVNKLENGGLTIRKIGSNTVCNIYNDVFYKIPKEIIGAKYEFLEGQEYKMYKKIEKAFSKYGDWNDNRFHSVEFDNDILRYVQENHIVEILKMNLQ